MFMAHRENTATTLHSQSMSSQADLENRSLNSTNSFHHFNSVQQTASQRKFDLQPPNLHFKQSNLRS